MRQEPDDVVGIGPYGRYILYMRFSLATTIVSSVLASSQGPQDALVLRLLSQIGHGQREYVEFGFDSNEHCSGGGGSNTCVLARDHGWHGLLLDGEHNNSAINLHAHFIYPTNIVELLKHYGVSQSLDYMSVDIDSVRNSSDRRTGSLSL